MTTIWDALLHLPCLPLALPETTGSGGKKAAAYTGVSLLDYCVSQDAFEIHQVVVSGADGYAAAVMGVEAGNAYLAWTVFGASLTLVFPGDEHRQRWVKDVTGITWQSEGEES